MMGSIFTGKEKGGNSWLAQGKDFQTDAEQWNFENWGIKYWSKTGDFIKAFGN